MGTFTWPRATGLGIWDFGPTSASRAIHTWRLDGATLEAPDLMQGWSLDGRSVLLAGAFPYRGVRTRTETHEEFEGDDHLTSTIWRFSGSDVEVFQYGSEGGFFGASYSANGDVISCCTGGTSIVLLSAVDLRFLQRLESFYSGVSPKPLAGSTPGSEIYISSLGFTICHAWSPTGTWLAAGNVGGIRLWRAERLQEPARS
jgi:hypothetical protein